MWHNAEYPLSHQRSWGKGGGVSHQRRPPPTGGIYIGAARRPPPSGWFQLNALGFISRNCIAVISGLRPLSPLWCLRHHLSPAKAGALWILSNVPHSSEGNRRANLPLRGRRRRRRQKGCISIARRAVCLFSTGEARLYGFAADRRHLYWRRKAPTSPIGQPNKRKASYWAG